MRKVLLVEDDLGIAETLESLLKNLRYHVTIARNGAEAVERAAADPPHLILMDIYMPVMDGIRAVAAIRDTPQIKSIPVIAVSTDPSLQAERYHRALGFDGYLAKPVTAETLRATIERLFSRFEAQT